MKKEIIVNVIPPCISWNREAEYISATERAYAKGKLADNMKIARETEATVEINYYR